MRQPHFYRYFFAFRPNRSQRRWLEHLAEATGSTDGESSRIISI
jgi:hypothetical protein